MKNREEISPNPEPERCVPTRQSSLDRLRSQLDLGLDQARRGELLDGETVFEELMPPQEVRTRGRSAPGNPR